MKTCNTNKQRIASKPASFLRCQKHDGNEAGFRSEATVYSNLRFQLYYISSALDPPSSIRSEGPIRFDNSRIDVVIRIGWHHDQRRLKDEATPRRVIPVLSSLGAAVVDVIDRVAERSRLEKSYEWTILSSETKIEGKYYVQIHCNHPDYDVNVIHEPKRVIVRATRL